MYEQLSIETKLGTISFEVTAKADDLSRAQLKSKVVTLALPTGMEIERATIVLLTVLAPSSIEQLEFTCSLGECFSKGEPCPGEALEAWEWESRGRLVVIGTEDEEWLKSRLKHEGVVWDSRPVCYAGNKVAIKIKEYVGGGEFSLHFVVSENALPERTDGSCWFSVDIPHVRVLSEFGEA